MIVLIPLGGIGIRFKENGYKNPKALVKIFGKPIIYYLLDNLNITGVDTVYIPYNREYEQFRFEDMLTKEYPHINFKFHKLLANTRGAAETINIALKELQVGDAPILCLDSDNFFTTDIVSKWGGRNTVFTMVDTTPNPIYSYVRTGVGNVVENIVEKQKISDYACVGAYGFSSWKMLLDHTQHILDKNLTQKGEFYTSGVIGNMIESGITFTNSVMTKESWICLGTPIQVRQFANNCPKISCVDSSRKIKSYRICFDFDNTLVTHPRVKGDYRTVEPIQKNIEFARYLKSFGNVIIIHTARNMKSNGGNIGATVAKIGKITFDTIEKFGIPCDEIYFGKPHADVYIDDLALNCYDDMEKELGFYLDGINPREFNDLKSNSIEVYTKRSHDLSGEIHYYNNIPRQIKDLFPIMLDHDNDNTWYTMEKITGVTVTTLYLSRLLTHAQLEHVMNSVKRIQSVPVVETLDIHIYDNYTKKMIQRYSSYDYSKYPNSAETHDAIMAQLTLYEDNACGKMTVIHGDTVFTNILFNALDKIKFIDMRGKIGSTLTIYGDWLYDWAKIYQSLIGYDKILQGKYLDSSYEESMIDFFRRKFIEMYDIESFEKLRWITKSLLFTLIPLHDNEKCSDSTR